MFNSKKSVITGLAFIAVAVGVSAQTTRCDRLANGSVVCDTLNIPNYGSTPSYGQGVDLMGFQRGADLANQQNQFDAQMRMMQRQQELNYQREESMRQRELQIQRQQAEIMEQQRRQAMAQQAPAVAPPPSQQDMQRLYQLRKAEIISELQKIIHQTTEAKKQFPKSEQHRALDQINQQLHIQVNAMQRDDLETAVKARDQASTLGQAFIAKYGRPK